MLYIRSVDTLREKYGILLMHIVQWIVLSTQLRHFRVPDALTCKWKHIVLNSYAYLPYTSSSWHKVLLAFDTYILVCYPCQYVNNDTEIINISGLADVHY